MAAASSVLSPQEQSSFHGGLRPVNLRKDLGEIADLIELAFGATMDSGGRAAIREMRSLSRSGILLWALAHLDRGVRSMHKGFVWIDPPTQRLVGNTSIYTAGYDNVLVVANVAVHPEFRRRGIATQLVEATQEMAQQEGTNAIILQVEADNLAARQLYERLGFENLRTFTRWRRHPAINPPDRPADMPDVTLRSGREWKAEYNLAQTLRPNERGGLGWLRPTRPGAFRKTAWQHMRSVFSTRYRQRWVVRGNAHLAPLRAAMSIETVFGSRFGRVDLLVAPEEQGTLEKPVLNFAIRHLHDQRRGLIVEHPSDDEHATEVFYDYRFEPVRHLVHMQWQRSR